MSDRIVQTKLKLALKGRSKLFAIPSTYSNPLRHCKISCFIFTTIMIIISGVPIFRVLGNVLVVVITYL